MSASSSPSWPALFWPLSGNTTQASNWFLYSQFCCWIYLQRQCVLNENHLKVLHELSLCVQSRSRKFSRAIIHYPASPSHLYFPLCPFTYLVRAERITVSSYASFKAYYTDVLLELSRSAFPSQPQPAAVSPYGLPNRTGSCLSWYWSRLIGNTCMPHLPC